MQRLDKYMGDALLHYYNTRDPFGVDGDFTTAPEISQLFGEIIGIWAVQKWIEIGSPSSFNLIEIGPGRGTLMSDLLRGTKHIQPFHNAMSIHLVETSQTLGKIQKKTLKDHNVQWHNHLSDVSSKPPAIIIANEFFDALPCRQFKFENEHWYEHYIQNQRSVWIECDKPLLKSTLPMSKNGDIFEYSDEQKHYAQLINNYNGGGLLIDYGYLESSYGDSLQALYKHAPCPVTSHAGNADITTHVDFEWISSFFKDSKTSTQSCFLKKNGIDIRYHSLANSKLKCGYERLINPKEMGDLFKVLEINLQKS